MEDGRGVGCGVEVGLGVWTAVVKFREINNKNAASIAASFEKRKKV